MRGEFRLRSSRALKLAQSDKTIRRRHYRHRDRGSTRHAGVEEGPTLSTFEMPIPGLFLAIRPLGLVLDPFLLRSVPLPHCPVSTCVETADPDDIDTGTACALGEVVWDVAVCGFAIAAKATRATAAI